MSKLKKDLQAVSKGLKALVKKTAQMATKVEKLEKAQAKAKPKAKSTKKARAKKRVMTRKKAPSRKVKTLTATDQVLKIINRSKKGVGVASLTKKTGFEETKVRNIVFKAFQQGKIKRVGRGVYRAA